MLDCSAPHPTVIFFAFDVEFLKEFYFLIKIERIWPLDHRFAKNNNSLEIIFSMDVQGKQEFLD